MRRRKLLPVEIWEQSQIARAAYFTACRFLGRGRYDTRRAETQAEAEAIGRAMGGAMIYAVTPEGRTIHVRNV